MEVSESGIDIIKSKVSIDPLVGGGSNFGTHVLTQQSSSKLVYKPSISAALFSFAFFAVGFGVLCFAIYFKFQPSSLTDGKDVMLIIFGLVFACAGGFMFYYFYMPRVFDKQLGVYYKAHRPKLHHTKRVNSKNQVLLKSIVAIQIIGEIVQGDKGSYQSFELNLILDDSSRRNVVDHGNLNSIIDDAEVLSKFLNIPIWHAKSSLY